jgi:hypothetical protein
MFELHDGLIDPKLFKGLKSSNRAVTYELYVEAQQSEDTLTTDGNLKLKTATTCANVPCFYDMRRVINASNPTYDRVCLSISRHETLNKNMSIRWLNLCKEHNFLPEYVPVESAVTRSKVCIALDKHTYNQVYVYLTVARCLQDEPGYITAALKLMDIGMQFIPALLAAAKVSVGNSNHHFLSSYHCTGNYYFDVKTLAKELVFVNGLVGLHRFINQHNKFNKPSVSGSFFNCNKNIEDAGGDKALTLPVEMLLHPGIDLLFDAETEKEVAVVMSLLNKTTVNKKG